MVSTKVHTIELRINLVRKYKIIFVFSFASTTREIGRADTGHTDGSAWCWWASPGEKCLLANSGEKQKYACMNYRTRGYCAIPRTEMVATQNLLGRDVIKCQYYYTLNVSTPNSFRLPRPCSIEIASNTPKPAGTTM